MALNFPWEMYQQVQEAKNRNRQQVNQNIAGLGQGLGQGFNTIGQAMQQEKSKKAIEEVMSKNPTLAPYAKLASMYPQEFMQNVLPKLTPKSGGSPEITIGPDGTMTIGGMPIAGQQPAATASPMTPAAPQTAGIGGMTSPGGPPPPPPAGRSFSVPITGNKAADLLGRGFGKGKVGAITDPAKAHFYESRATSAEVGALSQIEKNIDPSIASKTTPIGAAASSVRRAINGLSLLQMPTVTKTSLEATMGDIDSIVSQAGATVEGRKMLSTPNFQSNLQAYRSFVSSAPDKVAAPPGMVRIYRDILTDLGPVAEKFVKDRVVQQSDFYRSRGEKLVGKEKYDAMTKRILEGFKIQVPGAETGGQWTDQHEKRLQQLLMKKQNGTIGN